MNGERNREVSIYFVGCESDVNAHVHVHINVNVHMSENEFVCLNVCLIELKLRVRKRVRNRVMALIGTIPLNALCSPICVPRVLSVEC